MNLASTLLLISFCLAIFEWVTAPEIGESTSSDSKKHLEKADSKKHKTLQQHFVEEPFKSKHSEKFKIKSANIKINEYNFDPVEYSMPFPPVLSPNNKLANAKRILVDELTAPESLLIEGNTIYTGTADGKILKIVDEKIVDSIQLNWDRKNKKCGTYETQPICGWPHGIRRLSPEYLIVIDSYLGLFRFNFENGKVENLIPGDYIFEYENNRPADQCALFNNLDVVKNGEIIFISCSSVRWDNRRAIHDFFEGRPNGRLIQYNVKSGKAQIVPTLKLNFPNGVQAHPDGHSILISELTRARIVRYYFDGPKVGKSEYFSENLPGFPDNIKLSPNGKSFLIGMDAARHSELLTTVEKLGPHPNLRKSAVLFIPEENMRSFYGTNMLKKYGLVLELDLDGKIINDWQDPTGLIVPGVSEANFNGTHLILGSSSANYISIIPQ